MIFTLLLFFHTSFLQDLHGACLTFKRNTCKLTFANSTGYKKCFICSIVEDVTSTENGTTEYQCSKVKDLHCIMINFTSIEIYQQFTSRYMHVINTLFDERNMASSLTQNDLIIQISDSNLYEFRFETFQILNDLPNRMFCCVRFFIYYKNDHVTLNLKDDIRNMTFSSLQILIHCDQYAFAEYTYMPTNDKQNQIDKMVCKAPENVIATTELSTTITELPTTTRKSSKKIIILVGIVGGGSLFPCLLLACCLYALCRQNSEQDDSDVITMKSISSDEVASMESGQSVL